ISTDDRQEPRPAAVERNRRETIVEEGMLDQLAGHPARHQFAERSRRRDAVAAVAAGKIHVVQLTRAWHLIARECDVAAPRLLDFFVRKLREDSDQTAP